MDREISNLPPIDNDVKSRVRIPLEALFSVILPAKKLARQSH